MRSAEPRRAPADCGSPGVVAPCRGCWPTVPLLAGALVFAVNGDRHRDRDWRSAVFEAVTGRPRGCRSGQSLWELAAILAPSVDPREVVSDIVHLNQLHGADVQPGQRLAIPRQYSH